MKRDPNSREGREGQGGGVCPSCRALSNACRDLAPRRDHGDGDRGNDHDLIVTVPARVVSAEIDGDCRFYGCSDAGQNGRTLTEKRRPNQVIVRAFTSDMIWNIF
jgi:hypothetical protein